MSLQMAWEQLELFPKQTQPTPATRPATPPTAPPLGWPDARYRTAVYRSKSTKTADTDRFRREETKQ
jgi:hypothetical protein